MQYKFADFEGFPFTLIIERSIKTPTLSSLVYKVRHIRHTHTNIHAHVCLSVCLTHAATAVAE